VYTHVHTIGETFEKRPLGLEEIHILLYTFFILYSGLLFRN